MIHILVIDDDPEILKFIKIALERESYQVSTAASTKEITSAKLALADLILLDIMMPGEDGLSFCQRIRQRVDCPILFVTARTSERDLVAGLGVGADDYIQKPFSVAELRARIAAHLRREARTPINGLHVGNFVLDLNEKKLKVGETPIHLTKSEYEICTYFLKHVGQVFSKGQLYEAVFGYEKEADESAVVEHIKNIRAKLKTAGEEPIETVWGIGYRWKNEKQ